MSTQNTSPIQDFIFLDPRQYPFVTIPPHLKGIFVLDLSQLKFLGLENLSSFLRYWRKAERTLTTELKYLIDAITTLDGRDVESMHILASQYENPSFFEIDHPANGIYNAATGYVYPEPTDPASLTRERNSTTFNVCGWCKHAKKANCHYNYAINPCCGLIDPSSPHAGHHYFDQDCLLTNDPNLLQSTLSYLKQRQRGIIKCRGQVTSIINTLTPIIKQASHKPPFPACRPLDYFLEEDSIQHFTHTSDKWNKVILPNQQCKLLTGHVTEAYDNSWARVTFPVQVILDGQDYGHSINLFYSSAHTLKTSECNYLRSHPDYFQIWLNAATAQDKDIEPQALAAAILYSYSPYL